MLGDSRQSVGGPRAIASPRGLDIIWENGDGLGGVDALDYVGYRVWLEGLAGGNVPVYDWRGFGMDKEKEERECAVFCSKDTTAGALLRRHRRLDDDDRAKALQELGDRKVTSLGLEFPELMPRTPSKVCWTLPKGRGVPDPKDFMHAFRAQNILMDAWDIYPPIVLDWIGATISHGVNLNFRGDRLETITRPNHPSIRGDPSLVIEELEKEMKEGRRPGWFQDPPFKWFVQSPVGQVPKTKVSRLPSGEYVMSESLRIIMDWSFGLQARIPGDRAAPDSINANIPLMDISCISFDQMVVTFMNAGPGAWATVFDFAHAHQSISVRPEDWPIGLVHLPGKGYAISTRCQYGSRRSGGVWEIFAELFTVLLFAKWGVSYVLRWVDDLCHFAKDKDTAMHVQALVVYLSQRYGFKLHPDKIRGPLQVAEFMGLEWCPARGTICLPAAKRFKYTNSLTSLLNSTNKWSTSDIHSALGVIVYLSRIFVATRFMAADWAGLLKSIVNLRDPSRCFSNSCKPPNHLRWHLRTVLAILAVHSGTTTPFLHSRLSSMVDYRPTPLEIFVDASGGSGWGAFVPSTKQWAYGSWSQEQLDSHWVENGKSSPLFEAQGICLALWSLGIRDQEILVRCDAEVVVGKYTRPSSRFGKIEKLNEAMLALCVSECLLNICIVLSHISGVHNVYADLLSRGVQGLKDFKSRATSEGWSPHDSQMQPTSPPPELCQMTPHLCW